MPSASTVTYVAYDQDDEDGSESSMGLGGLVEMPTSEVGEPLDTMKVGGSSEPLDSEVLSVLERCQALLEQRIVSSGVSKQERQLVSTIIRVKRRLRTSTSSRHQPGRHRRFSLSSDSRMMLKQWFDAHSENPYPTPLEKQVLAATACMTVKQVNDWFTNHRKRHWDWQEYQRPESPNDQEGGEKDDFGDIDIALAIT